MGTTQSIVFDETLFKEKKIPIPKFTFPFDNDNIDSFIHLVKMTCEPKNELEHTIRYIFDNTIHITFNDFIKYLVMCVQDFVKNIKKTNDKFMLYIPQIDFYHFDQKSNYWVSKIVYHILEELKTYPIKITNSKDDLIYKNILICDDGIFTGEQMTKIVNDPIFKEKIFHIVSPVISDRAKNKINEGNKNNIINFYNKKDIFSSKEHIKYEYAKLDDIEKNKFKIYFDHKIPDNNSTFFYLYTNNPVKYLSVDKKRCLNKVYYNDTFFNPTQIIGDKQNISELKIPISPYKKYVDDIEKIYTKEISSEELINDYIIKHISKTDGRKKKKSRSKKKSAKSKKKSK